MKEIPKINKKTEYQEWVNGKRKEVLKTSLIVTALMIIAIVGALIILYYINP